MSEKRDDADNDKEQQERDAIQEEFFKIISAQGRKSRKLSELVLEETGLTVPQMIVLLNLKEHDGNSTMQNLAHRLHQTGGAMTNLVDRLFNAGLVRREAVPQDRRIVQVVLTEQGKEKIEVLHRHFVDEYKRICTSLSNDELIQFTTTIQKLSAAIDDEIQRLSKIYHKNL